MNDERARRRWELVKRSKLPRVFYWGDDTKQPGDGMNTAELERRLDLDAGEVGGRGGRVER